VTPTACPACRSGNVRAAFSVASATFWRCRECSSLFDVDPPDADELRRWYQGRGYFVKDGDGTTDWGYADDYLADRPFTEAKFDRVLGHLERYVQPGRLLDVGAGPGFLLTAAQARGWEAVGLELNDWAASYARDEVGVDVQTGELTAASYAGEQFDAVTMMDVIEHVTDPDDLLEQAARLVRPGGALALLTPDAGALTSRLMGQWWPEVRRPGEHMLLFSVAGLTRMLARHGFVASGWHTIGKTAPVATLVADVLTPVGADLSARFRDALVERKTGRRVVEFDPRTKFVLYARRLPDAERVPTHRPARVPRRPEELAHVDTAILEELESLASARRLCDWMFDGFARFVAGARILEVGAGIGNFSRRMLDAGAKEMVLIEPEPSCAGVLEEAFSAEERVTVTRDYLPDAPVLAGQEGTFDLVVCQNVLEHIGDDRGALAAMADSLRPGGRLALVVPGGPWLYGALDDAYGHWRRYSADDVRAVVSSVGLEPEIVRPMNALGIVGWWTKNRRPGARIGPASLRAYEALVGVWRPLEDRVNPRVGLSVFCLAVKPEAVTPQASLGS
jgi:2-polyprenyl-3-methyl-5-hydroxy-6-metoxy-1,4-benzoquinol methylase